MFITVDRMRVRPDRRQAFMLCWRTVAEATQEYSGSLGSRLHVTDEGDFIDYTQWPDRRTCDLAVLPESYNGVTQRMRDSCDELERVFAMDLADDHLDHPASADRAAADNSPR